MSTSEHRQSGLEETNYRKPDDEPDPELRDNPMALVFPAPLSDQEVYDRLFVEPPERPKGFTELPLEQRLEWLDRLDEFYIPFPLDGDILTAVVSLVRKSLRHRHPKNPAIMFFIMRVATGVSGSAPRMQLTGGGGALGLLVSGPTGTGKTSLLDRIVEHLGRHARYHYSLLGKPCAWPQLGVIRITVGKTWKDTLIELMKEIDRQYGRDVLFTRERGATEPRLQHVVWTALCSGFAPCIILDEFQRLGNIKRPVALKIMERLIDLMQDGGIPVVVAGTVAVRHLFEAFPMEMSKFSSGNKFAFERLKEGDPDTSNFIMLLKEQAVSIASLEYSEDFERYLMLHTMGVRRMMRDFMRWVFHRHAAAESSGEIIKADKALLASIAANEMGAFQKALSALRKFELGFELRYEELQIYEHFVPQEPEKRKTRAQTVVEALWRAEDQAALDDDFRLVSVEDFIFLRSQIALYEYQQDAERVAPAQRPALQGAEEPSSEKPSRRRATSKSPPEKKTPKAAGNPVSNIIPLSRVKPPPPVPEQGVDPGNLPD